MNYYGDQVEIERQHSLNGQPGKIRVLAYRNVENMGRWNDAINAFLADPGKNATTCPGFNYGSSNATAPRKRAAPSAEACSCAKAPAAVCPRLALSIQH